MCSSGGRVSCCPALVPACMRRSQACCWHAQCVHVTLSHARSLRVLTTKETGRVLRRLSAKVREPHRVSLDDGARPAAMRTMMSGLTHRTRSSSLALFQTATNSVGSEICIAAQPIN